MKVNATGVDITEREIYIVLAVVAGIVILAGAGVAKAAQVIQEDLVPAVTPTNPENVFNQAVNSVGQAVTGEADWTLGGQIYDWTH